MNFQEMILALQQFWAEQGCVIWNPYNVQVGAGTNNPATLLRVLGPEPWRVAYVEPSIRPDDGRYGENPNRMQRFLQYQVILKPEPGNPQELYLESLAKLGIRALDNDIRFVEDNWQSPPLGAWGLGWEVWLNGQEIAQFTYFQQAAGLPCDPVSVEITYGLERMAMAIQKVDSVWDIRWQGDLTYGDVYLDEERAHSKYYFEIADVKGLRAVYETYRREHERALAADAVLPAYDYVLKCNHIFNVLDARGAVGVTERAQFFRTMHGMTRACANAYLAEREKQNKPLLEKMAQQWTTVVTSEAEPESEDNNEIEDHAAFLLEIGVEELPAADVRAAEQQLNELSKELLGHSFEIFSTPRRLAVFVEFIDMIRTGSGAIKTFRGPPAKIAFDENGKPTAAAIGFARSKGVRLADLHTEQYDGGKYVVARVLRPIDEILTKDIPALVEKLRFPRTMRWNQEETEFSRPIRWLVALKGTQVLPICIAGIPAGRVTRGHRREGSPLIKLDTAADYKKIMGECGIQLDSTKRREEINLQIVGITESLVGKPPDEPELLDEVTNLVEKPIVLRGNFDIQFLKLPEVVLTTVMKKHQRYFPLRDALGYLMPNFLVVCDGTDNEGVLGDNEKVLAARFSDAQFFYEQDRKQPLEAYLPRLDTLTFHEKLGSMLDKSQRLEQLVIPLATLLGFTPSETEIARQAAHLCKADLATQMVVELTSLQGEMGCIYAKEDGIDDAVAEAIYEHWLPRQAGDELPQSKPGILLALADRLDSLVDLMGVGEQVTSSADPFGLRRTALGVIRVSVERELDVSFPDLCRIAAPNRPIDLADNGVEKVLGLMRGRLYYWLNEITPDIDTTGSERGIIKTGNWYALEAVDAVMSEHMDWPLRAVRTLEQLIAWTKKENWSEILDGYARCVRITKDVSPDIHTSSTLLKESAEIELHQKYQQARDKVEKTKDVDTLLESIENMLPAITRFFDEVLVMAEDEEVRRNRLALLKGISSLADGIVDLSVMPGF